MIVRKISLAYLLFLFSILLNVDTTVGLYFKNRKSSKFCPAQQENGNLAAPPPPACKRIYILNIQSLDFLSLLNVSISSQQQQPKKQQQQRTIELETLSLQGTTVRVIADNMLPYVTSSNHSQQLGGYLGDIWTVIQNMLKFKTNVTSVFYPTGLKMIQNGQADVMLAAVVMTKNLSNVNYSQPYFINWYNLFIRQPEARASSASYLKTFNRQLWFFTLATFVILTMSLWLTSNFLNRTTRSCPPRSRRSYRHRRNISIPSCFLAIVSGFINQGYDLKLQHISSRILIMFALIFGIVLYSAMNALLVAQLAVFEIPLPFHSLNELADKRSHSLCLRTNSFVYNNFTNEHHRVVPKWRGILNGIGCLDINNQSNLPATLCSDKMVVVLENRVVMHNVLKMKLPCNVIDFHQKYFTIGNTLLMSRNFQYKQLINRFMKQMKATGVLRRLEDKWVRREKLVDINTQKSPQVTIDHISGVLGLYLFGICSSLIILGCEILCFNCGYISQLLAQIHRIGYWRKCTQKQRKY